MKNTTGNNIRLTTNNDSNVEGVSYSLLKDNSVINENNNGTFEFQNIQTDFEGVYNIKIQTTLLPDVYLISTPIQVNVSPCIDVDLISITDQYAQLCKKSKYND